MHFLIELPENCSFALSNNLHTGSFELFTLSPFFFPSLLKQASGYSQILCVYGAVLGPIFRSLFSMADSSWAASRDESLGRLHVWKE